MRWAIRYSSFLGRITVRGMLKEYIHINVVLFTTCSDIQYYIHKIIIIIIIINDCGLVLMYVLV